MSYAVSIPGIILRVSLTLSHLLLVYACSPVQPAHPPPTACHPPTRTAAATTIRKAVNYLAVTQVTEEDVRTGTKSLPGDWPHYSSMKHGPLRLFFRDTNPFAATFIHHALSHVTRCNAKSLSIGREQLEQATTMREMTIELMQRFKEPAGSPTAGSYGYWLRPTKPPNAYQRFIGRQILRKLKGPILNGRLAPMNVPAYPREFMVWPDADDTAVIYVSLKENAELHGKPLPQVRLDHFATWRDLPGMNRRVRSHSRLKPDSGVFLTWFPDPGSSAPNEADIVVNANVLYALAQFNAKQTPGFKQAVTWINRSVSSEAQHYNSGLRPYYINIPVFHYTVSRAFREGPVPSLRPSMKQLVRELNNSASARRDGTVYWPSEDPVLSTSCALITYLNAGDDCGHVPKKLVDGAARHLIRCQRPDGSWRSSWAHFATTDSGVRLYAKSDAWTTAITLEALCRYQLQR